MLKQPQIIYEDANVLVVAKPAGMLVHPTVKLEPDTLYGFVKNYYIGLVGDSGRFQYSSTSPLSFEVAKCLLERNINIIKIYESMYQDDLSKLEVIKFILNNYK